MTRDLSPPTPPEGRWHGALSEERTHHIWRKVHAELEQRERPTRPARLAGGLLLAAAVALATLLAFSLPSLWGRGEEVAARGALLETEASPMAMTLDEGSSLSLAAQTSVQLAVLRPERVQLRLERGTISCDVTQRPDRLFSVVTGDIEVRVVGTKFSVLRGNRQDEAGIEVQKVEVQVERGVVEVWRRDGSERLERLVAGQAWSSEERLGPHRTPSDNSGPSPAGDDRAADPAEEMALDHAGAPPAGDAGLEPTEQGNETTNPRTPQGAVPPAIPAGRPPGDRSPSDAAEDDPGKRLFAAATAARRGGDSAQAAAIYEQLIRAHASDPRAGLAAFELGRLQMDHLGRPSDALKAFRQALQLAPGASFREDVLARIPQVYASLGQQRACAKARDAYQNEYPRGVHRRKLDGLCR